jgi:transcriptional regulator of arginine metabolism
MAISNPRARQLKILEIISSKPVETQEELTKELNRLNYNVTQATVSRDIKELGLIKILDGERYRYAQVDGANVNVNGKLVSLFWQSVLSIDSANNLIVIKTLPGSANTAAMVIDKLNLPSVLGSIAGDDTLMVVVKSNKKVSEVIDTLKSLR